MKLFTALIICICTIYFLFVPRQQTVLVPAGYEIKSSPVQDNPSKETFAFKGYQIKPLADFTIKARILSYKNYSSDKESDLSPIDLALGWGPMSKSDILSKIEISQRNRWYFWSTDNFPIPRSEIETNSANMHIIPSDESISKKLANVKRGQVVELTGHLVECTQGGWKWKSSLSRSDVGGGACEVIFVKQLSLISVK